MSLDAHRDADEGEYGTNLVRMSQGRRFIEDLAASAETNFSYADLPPALQYLRVLISCGFPNSVTYSISMLAKRSASFWLFSFHGGVQGEKHPIFVCI